jgi:hypothetical protein
MLTFQEPGMLGVVAIKFTEGLHVKPVFKTQNQIFMGIGVQKSRRDQRANLHAPNVILVAVCHELNTKFHQKLICRPQV